MDQFRINGITYASDSSLTFGDYGGAGSVGRANIDCVLEDESLSIGDVSYSVTSQIQDLNGRGIDGIYDICASVYGADVFWGDGVAWSAPDGFHAQGNYGSETVWLRLDADGRNETLDALADYPCIDDEAVSEIESQWEREALNSWARSDLLGMLDESVLDKFEALLKKKQDDVFWEAYAVAMDKENQYPIPEYSGSHIPVDRIAKTFAQEIQTLLT